MPTKSDSGFNVIELAVVTAVVMLAAAIFYHGYERAIMRSLMSSVAARGRDVYVAIAAANAEREAAGLSPVWPADADTHTGTPRHGDAAFDFKNSTDYFRYLIGKRICPKLAYDCLATGGMPVCVNGDLAATNNMWTVVKNMRDDADDTWPVFVTRNIDLSDLPDKRAGSTAVQSLRFEPGDDCPFGRDDGLVIRKGGSVFLARGRSLTYSALYGSDFNADGVAPGKPELKPIKYLTPTREVRPTHHAP